MNYARNTKYFRGQTFVGEFAFIVLGGSAIVVGLAISGWDKIAAVAFVLVGIVMAVGATLSIRSRRRRRVTDEEIDQSVSDKAEQIRSYALTKLNVDPSEVSSVDPVFVVGYDFNDATLFRKGKDEKYRTNIGEVVVIYFADEVLHAYKERFSLTNSSNIGSETHAYFYTDVVSISTATGKVDTRIGKVYYDEFRLTTSGGTTVGCSIRDQQLSERSIQGAKTLVMERKRGKP